MVIDIVILFDKYLNPMINISSKNMKKSEPLQNQNIYVFNKK
jgi:hypothetical protein